LKISAGDGKQTALWKVVRMVRTLTHGQASVESGFSVNKKLLIENMEEETIVAQRIVFDAVRLSDMDITKTDMSQKMMACVRQSHAAYKRALQLKDKQSEEERIKTKVNDCHSAATKETKAD